MKFKQKFFSAATSLVFVFGSFTPSQTAAATPYPYLSGSLVREGKTIYLINSVDKIPFSNMAAFLGLGYSLKNVVKGNLNNYKLAKSYVISSSDIPHPWGSWLLNEKIIYYSGEQGLIGVPDMATFAANGGQTKMILPANKHDIEIIKNNLQESPLGQNDSRVFRTPANTQPEQNLVNQDKLPKASDSSKKDTKTNPESKAKLTPAPPSTAEEAKFHLISLSPTAGNVGSFVVINGLGFDPTNNTVRMGNFSIGNYNSPDGVKISFSIPSSLNNCNNIACTNVSIPVNEGDFGISVENSKGVSNSLILTVTGSTGKQACEYAAPPPGYHYEGGGNYPECGARLVPDGSTGGLKFPSDNNGATNKVCEYAAPPAGYHYEGGGSYPDCSARLVPDSSAKKTDIPLPAICEYPPPPPGYHYEGGNTYPFCGAQLVPDNTGGLKFPIDENIYGVCEYAFPPFGYHYEQIGKFPDCSAKLVKDPGVFDYLPSDK